MRRIAHISDLHFGTVPEGLAASLAARLRALTPDLVIVSGDLTQRARAWQFRKARALLDRLGVPWLCVPGNHDIPLYNLPLRLLAPFRGYRRHISSELEPVWSDESVQVVGVNTVNPLVWQAGRVGAGDIARVCGTFAEAGGRLRLAVMHHPLTHGPKVEKRLMAGAPEALAALSACGADVVLCGHLHAWAAAPMMAREGGREVLMVQAGTTLSTRLRGEENDFNLLLCDGPDLTVERWAAAGMTFRRASVHRFRRDGTLWRPQVPSGTTSPDGAPRMAPVPSAKSAALTR